MTKQQIKIGDAQLEVAKIKAPVSKATVMLLHEALGGVELWKNFPAALSQRTSCDIVMYSRFGHGRSAPFREKREIGYLHKEAQQILPEVLAKLDVADPILFGHSDGASIALIYAGSFPAKCRAVIAEAPHLFVEEITLQGIRDATTKWEDNLDRKLARYHDDAQAVYDAWQQTWLDPKFRAWNMEEDVVHIVCPVLAIQGADDQYGTLRQVERIKELAPQTELCVVPNCGHAPHVERREQVLDSVAKFLGGVL